MSICLFFMEYHHLQYIILSKDLGILHEISVYKSQIYCACSYYLYHHAHKAECLQHLRFLRTIPMQSRPLLKINHLLILPSADTENKASTFSSPVRLSSCRLHLSCHTGPKCLLEHSLHRHIQKDIKSNNVCSISVSCKNCTH